MKAAVVAALAAAVLLAGCGAAPPKAQTAQQHPSAPAPLAHLLRPSAATALPTVDAVAFSAPFPQRPALTSVRMNTASSGWAILQLLHGTAVAHTSDGGATWRTLTVTRGTAIQVDSPTPDTAFVLENTCGKGSCSGTSVLATFDTGHTWQTLFQSTRFTGGSISFPSPSIGFIAGDLAGSGAANGALYSTTTAGLTWVVRASPCVLSGPSAQAVSFLGPAHGVLLCGGAAGSGEQPKTFYTTGDGGRTWSAVSSTAGSPPAPSGLPLSGYVHSMFFQSASTGFIGLDRSGIYMTRDGGAIWQPVFGTPLPTASGQAFSVGFSDPEHGWLLAGDGPPLYTTADGGLTWQLVYPPLSPSTSISFFSTELGYAAGWTYDGATVLRTVNGGSTWTAAGDAPTALSAIAVLGPSELMALGQAAIYASYDAGRTWQVEPFARGWYPAALGMATLGRGWVIGYSPVAGRELFATQNGGDTWKALPAPFTPSAVAPLGGQDVLAVGTPTAPAVYLTPDKQHRQPVRLTPGMPYLWRSNDGGSHWTPLSLPHWQSRQGAPSGMRVGNHGLVWLWSQDNIWLSSDGGFGFRRIAFRQLALGDVSFASAADGWLLTTSGALYRTSDGGLTWQEIANSVSF